LNEEEGGGACLTTTNGRSRRREDSDLRRNLIDATSLETIDLPLG
jgi:hypothetical protein